MLNIAIEYSEVSKLLPYAMNARMHSDSQVDDIARSIQEFGFVNPVLVDEAGEIIGGHGRVMAAKKLGLTKVPTIRIGHLSERQVKALRLADNKIQQKSSWNAEMLAAELSALAELDMDLSLTGFDEQELDALLKNDLDILPERVQSEMLSTEGGRTEPAQQDGDLVPVTRPRTTDDQYSTFELVMDHQNKVRLVELLSRIRSEHSLTKLEDALMMLVQNYEEN